MISLLTLDFLVDGFIALCMNVLLELEETREDHEGSFPPLAGNIHNIFLTERALV